MFRLLFLLALLPLFGNEEISQVCDQYTRPFSILNLNAGNGDLALSLAKKYPHAVVVLSEQDIGIDNKLATNLLERVQKETELKNVIIISGQINVQDVELLAKCEHFDIVICSKSPTEMNLPLNTSAEEITLLLKQIGCHVFIDQHLIENEEKPIITKLLLFRDESVSDTYKQSYSHFQTFATCDRTKTTHALFKYPGLSLITFHTYRGIWPELSEIGKILSYRSTKKYYKGATPWNVIISGETINFNIPPSKIAPQDDLLCPSLWQIWDEFFECKSKREMSELIESTYFD